MWNAIVPTLRDLYPAIGLILALVLAITIPGLLIYSFYQASLMRRLLKKEEAAETDPDRKQFIETQRKGIGFELDFGSIPLFDEARRYRSRTLWARIGALFLAVVGLYYFLFGRWLGF